jgi:hypothetical protein
MQNCRAAFGRVPSLYRLLHLSLFVSSVVFCGVVNYSSFAQSSTYSSWTQTTGGSQIQYRWKAGETPNCEVEVRNVDDKDRKYYTGSISYTNHNTDGTAPIVIEHFNYGGQINHHLVTSCTQVSDVLLNVRDQ